MKLNLFADGNAVNSFEPVDDVALFTLVNSPVAIRPDRDESDEDDDDYDDEDDE